MEFKDFICLRQGMIEMYTVSKINKLFLSIFYFQTKSEMLKIGKKCHVELRDQFREYAVTRINKIGMREVSDVPF